MPSMLHRPLGGEPSASLDRVPEKLPPPPFPAPPHPPLHRATYARGSQYSPFGCSDSGLRGDTDTRGRFRSRAMPLRCRKTPLTKVDGSFGQQHTQVTSHVKARIQRTQHADEIGQTAYECTPEVVHGSTGIARQVSRGFTRRNAQSSPCTLDSELWHAAPMRR